jgi:hypothetical protein
LAINSSLTEIAEKLFQVPPKKANAVYIKMGHFAVTGDGSELAR